MSKIKTLKFEFVYEFELIGICTSLPHYQLCYFLNKYLNSKIGRMDEDLDLWTKDKTVYFPAYTDIQTKINRSWYLIQNKIIEQITPTDDELKGSLFEEESHNWTKEFYLLPERQDIDYILQIHPPFTKQDITEIKQKIKQIDKVKTVFSVNPNTTKDIENLLIH